MKRFVCVAFVASLAVQSSSMNTVFAQAKKPVRGSIVEDRAAKKLIEAGDGRYQAEEYNKAVDVWESVLERYPRSRHRFLAHMKLGDHYLNRDRAYEKARKQYEDAAHEDNRDEQMRAQSTLNMGVCFYQARNYGKTFTIMRQVIEKFPVSKQVNQAYYYIGLGHFQLGHYSRAIAALERVGTAFAEDDDAFEKVEAGKRLFVRIEDADLAALEAGQTVKVKCVTTQGDEEIVECHAVGRNVRLVMGSIITQLGKPKKNNGRLDVRGDDVVKVTYIDRHTADKEFNRKVLKDIVVIGNGLASVMDGAYRDALNGAVLGKEINLQVTDGDLDLSDNADKLTARVEVWREKSIEEIEEEIAAAKAKLAATNPAALVNPDEEPEIERYKKIDGVAVTLTEAVIKRDTPAGDSAPGDAGSSKGDGIDIDGNGAGKPNPSTAVEPVPGGVDATKAGGKVDPADALLNEIKEDDKDDSIHTGVFRTTVTLVQAEEVNAGDNQLQAQAGDQIRLVYEDKENVTAETIVVVAKAKAVEGNLGGVRVTRTEISNKELRIQTQLKTASALTNIGNRYKEFGLKEKANNKYGEALGVCEEIMVGARKLGGRVLEETYVQLWKIYFEMDKLELAAAMAQRLAREFPESAFVDDALLQLADVARKRGELKRAVGIYGRLVAMKDSQLRGEAQFGIAECYEQMASDSKQGTSTALFDRAFQEYKKVFENFPDSGRVGEAVAKMANFYYQKKDYARAIDVFEQVMSEHPDAKYLDVILFTYGRCLYRMNKKAQARRRFDQLIGEFPESGLANDAKRISDALAKAGF
jgi:tetratricopeptide (TPR) repeat protein